MIPRPLIAALALGLGLSASAEALPLLTAPLAARTAGQDRTGPGGALPSTWVDPPRAAAPVKPGARVATAPTPAEAKPVELGSAEVKPAEAPATPRETAAPSPNKPAIRSVRTAGGEGKAWRSGRNAYAFSGSFGGCRVSGHAGPRGFTLDRAC